MKYKNYKKGVGAMPIIIVVALIIIIGAIFISTRDSNYANNELPIPLSSDGITSTEKTNNADINSATTSTNNLPVEGSGTTDGAFKEETLQEVIVKYTDNGFSPKKIEIPVGTTVTFVNESTNNMWVASAVHPSHTAYPGSGILKCGTKEESIIFDECGSIGSSGSYSFVFNKVGSWVYHNHVKISNTGSITVK